MSANELYNKIILDLSSNVYFSVFKFRKRDDCFISQKKGFKRDVMLRHWIEPGELVVYPIYGIRYDALLNWFKKYSFKSLQDQKDNYSFGFAGTMLGCKENYYKFKLDGSNFKIVWEILLADIINCLNTTYSNYKTLELAYKNEIEPILSGEAELPTVGIDWAFIDLTLCKIVAPHNYMQFKKIMMQRIEYMHSKDEPNLAHYYDRLDEILEYMESLTLEELEKCKL
ncbi:MAG: hypothetical protein IKP37_06600 [Paludibacteraceae bacterium]|nr:hypothetical protein [Paludibacteraceae bacterium]